MTNIVRPTATAPPASSSFDYDGSPREREPSLGPLTVHRVFVALYVVGFVVGLYRLQDWVWPLSPRPTGWLEVSWSWGALLWLSSVIPSSVGLIGLLWYRRNPRLDHVRPIDTLVCFRIVSRGTNIQALAATVEQCWLGMLEYPLFPYVIEVLTDVETSGMSAPDEQLRYLVVPPDYVTPNGSLYKARALQWALEHSPLPDDAWIVHLDEETHPTASGIRGIAVAVLEEEVSGQYRIGQGCLTYHRSWAHHPFLTLADTMRTGDDLARFFFQHKLGITLFGLHGSYILVRNSVEKEVGFDFGPQGSITEDAFWALVCMANGRRARWVDGYLEEQSTQSISDFVKQRRRWFQGLVKVARYAPVKLRWRLAIGLNTLLWALAPVSLLYTLFNFWLGTNVHPAIRFFANFAFAAFSVLYFVGLRVNLTEHGIRAPWRRAFWAVAQLVALPVFSLMEGAGVLLGIIQPVAGFHVVNKDRPTP